MGSIAGFFLTAMVVCELGSAGIAVLVAALPSHFFQVFASPISNIL